MLTLIIFLLIILIAVCIISYSKLREYHWILQRQRLYAGKLNANYRLLQRIIWLKRQGLSLSNYLLENGYRNIAIYGLSYIGEYLLEELKESAVSVIYAIDKRAEKLYTDVLLKRPDDHLPEADVIIVTAVFYYSEIEESLRERVECPVLSLEDVLYEII